jgi:selenocysteine lyase/cysteine desulfurase
VSSLRESTGYLDFARFGPQWAEVVAEEARLTGLSATAGPSTVDELMRGDARARAAVARLCGTDADHVVLLPNTSTGLFQVAFGLAGDVLVAKGEFPANTYPWVRAGKARWLPTQWVTAELVRQVPDTAAVSVSAVDFRTGYRADLAALREAAGDRLLIVDGIQGFGVIDEPWQVADVLVVGGQKWLRAGWSTGFMTLSDRALERLEPVLSGWTGATEPGLFDNEVHPPAAGAAAWSLTNLSPIAAGTFATALEIVERLGVPAIEAGLDGRVNELADVIKRAGGDIVSAPRRAGILAFTLPGRSPADIGTTLAAHGITATVRTEHIRLSPHVSTTAETVELLAAALTWASPTPP